MTPANHRARPDEPPATPPFWQTVRRWGVSSIVAILTPLVGFLFAEYRSAAKWQADVEADLKILKEHDVQQKQHADDIERLESAEIGSLREAVKQRLDAQRADIGALQDQLNRHLNMDDARFGRLHKRIGE